MSLLLRVAKRREGNEFRAGPSRGETGVSQRLTDEEFLSLFVFSKIGLLKLEVFAIPFRHKHSEAVHQTQGRRKPSEDGGIR